MNLDYWDNYYLNTQPNYIPWNQNGKILFDKFSDALILKSPILDVGCGTGYKVKFLDSLGYDAYGFDISKEAVKIANNEKIYINLI